MLAAPTLTIAGLRATEFRRLDASGETYLDHTGSALYPESLVRRHARLLGRRVLGNPHSDNRSSRASTTIIERARAHVLRFFDADPREYTICFTANASAAIRLVGESFPFTPSSRLVLSADNHNSVNGLRELARAREADVEYLALDDALRLAADIPADAAASPAPHLLAFPAQSNFSGVRHPLALVHRARALGYTVLLDAAAYVPTSPLSLRDVPADFVAISFYKMFGYPTGIGALVARRDALATLRRPWFAGGTVDWASVQLGRHALRAGAEAFEDGTPDFLAMPAVRAGLRLLERLGMERVRAHVDALTEIALRDLQALRHASGRPLVRIYGPGDMHERGGTIAFNVLDADGTVVPYPVVEARGRARRVSVRGGCFCNPGASERAFGFDAAASARCLDRAGREGFTIERFAECLDGPPVGAVRLSLGLSSTEADVRRGVALVASWRDQRYGATS